MIEQFHLKGPRHSGRVVRMRMLDPFEHEDNLTSTAKMLGKSVDFFELKKTEWRNGIKRCITEVSEPVEDASQAKLRKTSMADLDATFSSLFTPKDIQVLEAVYRSYHEATSDEVEAIVGKAVPVSEG